MLRDGNPEGGYSGVWELFATFALVLTGVCGIAFVVGIYYAHLHWFYAAFNTALLSTVGLWAAVILWATGWPLLCGASRLDGFAEVAKEVRRVREDLTALPPSPAAAWQRSRTMCVCCAAACARLRAPG